MLKIKAEGSMGRYPPARLQPVIALWRRLTVCGWRLVTSFVTKIYCGGING
jgi:hypothetical protein